MNKERFSLKSFWSLSAGVLAATVCHVVSAVTPAQDPLFLTQPVRPIMMLNMSNDHQLFFKLYDDYSNLEPDVSDSPNTTYTRGYNYFGYFDSQKCYIYDSDDGRFNPSGWADTNYYCNQGDTSNEWSGNFLNWSTMTRMDAVRKILYGGKRSIDTAASDGADSVTVLERAFLPTDAHSFAKHYDGDDLDRLTPHGANRGATDPRERGITLCNTTDPGENNVFSQDVTSPPLIRVAKGNFSLWASNERWQCRWGNEISGGISGTIGSGRGSNWNYDSSGDDEDSDEPPSYLSPSSGIFAYNDNPQVGQQLAELNARVLACDSAYIGDDNNENCKRYGDSFKPTGLLQEYGQNGSIWFGLMTGSYSANKSGGVLRKNVGDMADEIDLDNGTFVRPEDTDDEDAAVFNGIVDTLDRLRIYGYSYGDRSETGDHDGTYHNVEGSDDCEWGLTSFEDGQCSNWGNPQTEIFLESLRYLAGKTATEAFNVSDSDRIAGLNNAAWQAPVNNENYCAPLNVLQFNASTSSYGGDNLDGAVDIGFSNRKAVRAATDVVGGHEGIHGNDYFVGEIVGGDNDQLCTAKTISNLSSARGTCPDAPRLEGSYEIAGLAYYARSEGISIEGVTQGAQQVRTFGVALAPAVPRVTVSSPNGNYQVGIQPACRNEIDDDEVGNCNIVDFKIVEQTQTDSARSGLLYVNWEDSEQGGDFDQDMLGTIAYRITNTQVEITTNVFAESTSSDFEMGFGYVIDGTTDDGFHAHSGINGFTRNLTAGNGCNNCRVGNNPSSHTYTLGASTAQSLEQPLYYAAKWGGYAEDDTSTDDIASSEPESYFYATDPRELQKSLIEVFDQVSEQEGSASAVATDSTSLREGNFVFQARFDSADWSGELLAFEVEEDEDGRTGLADEATFTTDDTMSTSDGQAGPASRRVVTTIGTSIGDFRWDALTDEQKEFLDAEDGRGQDRLNWIRGSSAQEGTGGLRPRENLLGDIVNSSPVHLGHRDRGYSLLGGDQGDNYAQYVSDVKRQQPRTLFVGANDGMLHAFDVENNVLQELFAFVPNTVYPKLAGLTEANYGRPGNPHQYTVDGPLAVGDAYFGGSWKSVLVGTFGAGGKGVFALDVTDRNDPQLIFELNSDDIGYVMGTPTIARMSDGEWAAVFGNGYGSDNASSQLVVVPFGSKVPKFIDTKITGEAAQGTGLSGPALLGNAYGEVRYAYAGDLEGNLWKFDLTSDDSDNWSVALDGHPMFQARDGSDPEQAQPIFGPPTLGRNAQKGDAVMVYFGTGKYFEDQDNDTEVDDGEYQSFYALADTGKNATNDWSLAEKRINQSGISRTLETQDGGVAEDATGHDGINWVERDGWHMDFSQAGERVINKPLLMFDRLLFPTIIPSSMPCDFGGQSWLMEVVAVGDRYVGENLLNEDGSSTLFDTMILGDLSTTVNGDDDGKLIISTSDGELTEEDIDIPAGALGRQSWRQLR